MSVLPASRPSRKRRENTEPGRSARSADESLNALAYDLSATNGFAAADRTTLVDSEAATIESSNRLDAFCRSLVARRLQRLPMGITVLERGERFQLGQPATHASADLLIDRSRFWRAVVSEGGLGIAESYIQGDWDTTDLPGLMRRLARHGDALAETERGLPRLLQPVRHAWNQLRRNSRTGSRRNIAAHYDLSNEFFELMLDPTMTYSAGIFTSPEATMEEASEAKYRRVCDKLGLGPEHHVLEIGCGWGGFAIYAARERGCRVTATTISTAQFEFAQRRIAELALEDRITLVKQDYRELNGEFDRIVSIEMVEAVEAQYLETYFAQCCRLLKRDGMMLLQAITIPDHRYARYQRSVDFIRKYIFPGGSLPCIGSIGRALQRGTDFRTLHVEDFGLHYGETMARWRTSFWERIAAVRQLGFDQRFIRMWDYYLCYCEAGFRERQIGVAHVVMSRPDCRTHCDQLGSLAEAR